MDDSNIFAEGKDPAELYGRVNRGLAELSRWFRSSLLSHSTPKSPAASANEMSWVLCLKYLGVNFD